MSAPELQDMLDNLDELRYLKKGWYGDDTGKPIDLDCLKEAREMILVLVREYKLPPPWVYPTPCGGVQAEWDSGLELRWEP